MLLGSDGTLNSRSAREGPGDVKELAGTGELPRQVTASGPVGHVHLDLKDTEPLALPVDGHRGLDTETASEGAGSVKGGPGEAALAVQRLGGGPTGRAPDPGTGQADHEAVPAQLDPIGEDRDRHVGRADGNRLDERARVPRRLPQVSVEEQQVPRGTVLLP